MRIFRKYAVILIVILFVLLITACSGAGSYQKGIYEDDLKISSEGDSYSYKSRVGNTEQDKLSLSFDGFYGKEAVWEITAKEDCKLDLDIKADIKSGRFKLCLINAEKEVTTIFEGSKTDILTISPSAGKNYITLVGSNAQGKIEAMLSETSNLSIKALGR